MAEPGCTALEVLDRLFLEIRHKILDVAADLDRIARAEGDAAVAEDPRMKQLHEALEVLLDQSGNDRAERVQMVFSLPYDPLWREEA